MKIRLTEDTYMLTEHSRWSVVDKAWWDYQCLIARKVTTVFGICPQLLGVIIDDAGKGPHEAVLCNFEPTKKRSQ